MHILLGEEHLLEQKEDGSYPVEDDYRIDYLAQHIKEIAKAVHGI